MIAVCLATKGRPDKLKRMVDSVPSGIPIYAYATDMGDVEEVLTDLWFLDFGEKTIIEANNLLIRKALEDNEHVSVVVACDDIEYDEGCFDVITEALKMSTNMIYGLSCSNMECNDDAFVCFGNEVLIENEGKPYCEEYEHFYADTEIGNWYKSQKRFKTIPAFFTNHHPIITGEVDETHTYRRAEKLAHDKEVYENRNLLHR